MSSWVEKPGILARRMPSEERHKFRFIFMVLIKIFWSSMLYRVGILCCSSSQNLSVCPLCCCSVMWNLQLDSLVLQFCISTAPWLTCISCANLWSKFLWNAALIWPQFVGKMHWSRMGTNASNCSSPSLKKDRPNILIQKLRDILFNSAYLLRFFFFFNFPTDKRKKERGRYLSYGGNYFNWKTVDEIIFLQLYNHSSSVLCLKCQVCDSGLLSAHRYFFFFFSSDSLEPC